MAGEHFGFNLGAFFTESLAVFYCAHLDKIDFGPMRALRIEVPLRIWRVFAFTINREHTTILRCQWIHNKRKF